MKHVFVDTVGLLAVWEVRDQWHGHARAAMEKLSVQGSRLVTTPAVLWECGNAAARKPYRADVEELRAELKATGRLIVPTATEEDVAWREYRMGSAGEAGIVDHLSFAIMRRLGITDAFTNDRHFAAAGFNILF
jgi:predicted nucleic acid-binding protein